MAPKKPLTHNKLKEYLGNLINSFYHHLQPRSNEFVWTDYGRDISRRVYGKRLGIQLNRKEAMAYDIGVNEVRRTAGNTTDAEISLLSKGAADSMLGTAVVESIFNPETQEAFPAAAFPEYREHALDALIKQLDAGPVRWEIVVPIANCTLTGRRFQMGMVQFVYAGPEFLTEWRRKTRMMIDATADSVVVKKHHKNQFAEDQSKHWRDRVVATTSTEAYDEAAALEIGRVAITRTVDIVNFLADIEFPHSPTMYLSGTAGSGDELSIVLSKQRMSLPWRRTGPLPIELHMLRRKANKRRLRLFSALLGASSLSWREAAVLAAARQCGRARLAPDPAAQYIHYAVALDALLPTKISSARDLSFFVAHVLGQSVAMRAEIKDLVYHLYNVRNTVVHGQIDTVLSKDLTDIRHIAIMTLLNVGLSSRSLTRLSDRHEMNIWLNEQLLR